MSTLDPKTGLYWEANSAEDAYYIGLGRPDLAPGSQCVGYSPVQRPAPTPPEPVVEGVLNPYDGQRYFAADAESAYYIRLGRPDLA